MHKGATSLAALAVLTAAVSAGAAPAAAQAAPTRLVLFIGDGVGASYWTAARIAADHLAVEEFPVAALVDTRSTDSKVTDSAAGATVFATGVRTFNGAIGVGPDSAALTTFFDVATERGMGTGVVATSRITHATPASFYAHVPDRQMEWEIARQLAESELNVVLGGGRAMLYADFRPDNLNFAPQLRERYTYLEWPEDLALLDLSTVTMLFGLFTDSHMPAAVRATKGKGERWDDGTEWVPERQPSLPAMTEAALTVLNHNPNGFALMVEGSQPDWRGHGKESLGTVIGEMLDFDRAIGVALEYQREHPETLIVVVADHETGGLAIQCEGKSWACPEGSKDYLIAAYTTGQHTAQMVPLFAKGPGAERFGGMISNVRVGQLLMEHMRGVTQSAPEATLPTDAQP